MRSDKLCFDQEKLHRDLLIRLKQLNKNQRQIKPISRATLDRMRIGKPITFETFIKCVEYLNYSPCRYLEYKKIKK